MFIILDMSWLSPSQIFSRWFAPIERLIGFILTGKSALERIIANRTLPFPFRVHQIEKILGFTGTSNLSPQLEHVKSEKNKSVVHDQLNVVVHKLDLYQKLVEDIRQIRMTKVTSTEDEHLQLFEKIWSRLVLQTNDDQEPMKMISKRWTKIGFQVRSNRSDDLFFSSLII